MSGDVSRLEAMAAHKRSEVATARAATPLDVVREQALAAPPSRDFLGALRSAGFGVIAEIKQASPAAGRIAAHLDVAALARAYVAGGAQALSVWTDARYFDGSQALLRQMRDAVPVPVLRKDIILEPYQVYESRSIGADAVLLIGAVLDVPALRALIRLAADLRMAAPVDVHREVDLDRALEAGADAIFIHNRDVGTFDVDLGKTIRMRPRIPAGVLVVSESGISTPADVALLRPHVDGILVGMGVMTSEDPRAAVRALLGAGT